PAAVRRIAAEASARQATWQGRLLLLPFWQAAHRPSLLAAAALLVLFMGSQLSIMRVPERSESSEAVRIEMRMEGGEVRIAWSDGRGRPYVVRKSSDPEGMAGVETHLVRGNAWVDSNPGSSP